MFKTSLLLLNFCLCVYINLEFDHSNFINKKHPVHLVNSEFIHTFHNCLLFIHPIRVYNTLHDNMRMRIAKKVTLCIREYLYGKMDVLLS